MQVPQNLQFPRQIHTRFNFHAGNTEEITFIHGYHGPKAYRTINVELVADGMVNKVIAAGIKPNTITKFNLKDEDVPLSPRLSGERVSLRKYHFLITSVSNSSLSSKSAACAASDSYWGECKPYSES